MWNKTRALGHSCKDFTKDRRFAFNFNLEVSISKEGNENGDEVGRHSKVNQLTDEAIVPNFVKGFFNVDQDCDGYSSFVEIYRNIIDDSERLGCSAVGTFEAMLFWMDFVVWILSLMSKSFFKTLDIVFRREIGR